MKVLIVDDHPLVRRGVSSTLSLDNYVENIQEASNVSDAILVLTENIHDIALVDLKLGREDGLEIVKRSKKKNLKTKFIILTSSTKKEDFTRACETGVDGYILKDAFAEDILYALHVVLRGKQFFYPYILQHQDDQSENLCIEKLSEREKDVLNELGNGLSNTQIAQKIFISENTVKRHVSSILAKLKLKCRTEAALYVNNLKKTDF